jgi:hypothetical protein
MAPIQPNIEGEQGEEADSKHAQNCQERIGDFLISTEKLPKRAQQEKLDQRIGFNLKEELEHIGIE